MSRVRDSLLPSFLAALAVHAALLGWIAARAGAPPPRLVRPPTQIRLVGRTPPPAPSPAPEPARRASPAGRAVRPPSEVARAAPVPAPRAAEPPSPPPQPRRFAVSMDALVSGGSGGVAVPVTSGPTAARGDPRLPSSVPVGDNTAYAADVTEVERAPSLLRQPSSAEMRALYPGAARREGVEADVGLELLVSERGDVSDVRVVSPAGQGFDEVARQLGRRMTFRPAQRGGRPIGVWIPWTWKFRLDG